MYFGQLKTFLGSLFSRRKKPEHDNA
jgi:hypothetical protein